MPKQYLKMTQLLENLQREGVDLNDITVSLESLDYREANEISDIYFTLRCHAKKVEETETSAYERAMRAVD